ncbi:helix-turn-helix transcriptional regulator [Alteromonas oceanisediminis]|uniref:helix-turn-helix transcriptional regulator n=1 Tax=Alteromonas oceanisediminis TaxID=2836180 RepID=UPI001BD9D6FE|nr:helix-turn-helix domain-containing protein [Alteromonas oceanisediminis]MBT0585379.1 helix-turn-helix domain-containing protein [Alteromonas oceanisediminis]
MSERDAWQSNLRLIGDDVAALVDLYVLILCGLWVALLGLAWFRFDDLPHGRALFILTLLWPLSLVEELIKLFPSATWLASLVGLTYVAPVLLNVGLTRMLYPLIVEQPRQRRRLQSIIVVLIVLLQVPIILLPLDVKVALLDASPVGEPLYNLPLYACYALGGAAIVAMGIQLVESMQAHQASLPEQVVDIRYYKMPAVIGLVGTLVSIAFCAVIIVSLVAFSVLDFSLWQSALHIAYATVLLLILILMTERRRYSPLPIDLDKVAQRPYSDELLRRTLTSAEQAMIQQKAYKVIGLRLRQLADAADVDPTVLAAATHALLKRNFRAFVYHYRLEYAKKVLMRSDAKVSSVAKRLGFHSEKFLSGVFVKYIEATGDPDESPATLHPENDALMLSKRREKS